MLRIITRRIFAVSIVLALVCVFTVGSSGVVASAPKYTVRQRFGVGVTTAYGADISDYDLTGLTIGWYSDWKMSRYPVYPRGVGIEYVQLIGVKDGVCPIPLQQIANAVQANPGSLWLVGNEPENINQGNCSPEQYAEVYHEVYNIVKQADPTARVAIGGVTEPTPLRLQWLDRVWDHYYATYGKELGEDVDVWNIHVQVLNEVKDSWGADIPVGIDATQGMIIDPADNASVPLFKQLVRAFRAWMAEKGEQDKELVISEYGVLLPSDYLTNGDQSVIDFMYGTFDFLLQATDRSTGCPSDEYRLVQRWLWYSLNDHPYVQPSEGPAYGFNGSLFEWDVATYPYPGVLTVFGEAYRNYNFEQPYRLYLSVVTK